MDPRRLSTADVLAEGILGMPAPETGEPKEGRERVSVEYDESTERLTELLEQSKNISCSEYYGIPIAWRKEGEEGYKGILLQYRNITVEKDFDSAREAAEWFSETAHAVMG